MSCSAKAAPPVPWNDLIAPPAAAVGAAGTGGTEGAGAGPCAVATELTELSTDCAAVTVRPALVKPLTSLAAKSPSTSTSPPARASRLSFKLDQALGIRTRHFAGRAGL